MVSENQATTRLVMEWTKIDTDTYFLKKVQNIIFILITKHMCNKAGYPYKEVPKDEKHFYMNLKIGTEQECLDEEQRLNKIGVSMVNEALDSVRKSRAFSILPRSTKIKFNNIIYDPEITPWEQLQQKLLYVGIGIWVVVKPLSE